LRKSECAARATQPKRRTGGFALACPKQRRACSTSGIVGAVEPECSEERIRSDPAIVHPRFTALVQIGLIAALSTGEEWAMKRARLKRAIKQREKGPDNAKASSRSSASILKSGPSWTLRRSETQPDFPPRWCSELTNRLRDSPHVLISPP
jgi:hypothetical protein